ncbi:MAG: ParB N-terminal domain-containing protein, partial [Gammaproteobacteria bacterium]
SIENGDLAMTTTDTARIARFKKTITEGRTSPPVLVYQWAAGDRYLADGRHRLRAYLELGQSEIPAEIFHVADAWAALMHWRSFMKLEILKRDRRGPWAR